MVQKIINGAKQGLKLAEITNPSCLWVDVSGNIYRHPKRVAMEPSAFMSFRDEGEAMR